ncbi:uncharacterized protein TNCV_3760841 [Trichonephila clavipes]|nr:uncharacterized protein TNCV_3760841 [Trichonephila clavipes]
MSTKLAWGLNTEVSLQTDHLIGTSAHTPQRPRSRKQDLKNPLASDQTFCPISGKFRFTYTASNGEFRCDQTMSELSNCPVGNTLGVKFRQCSFPDMGQLVQHLTERVDRRELVLNRIRLVPFTRGSMVIPAVSLPQANENHVLLPTCRFN